MVSASTTDTGAVSNNEAAVAAISGKLDTLWADTSAFRKLPAGKTVFVFTIGGKDTLTLHGWNAKGANDDTFLDNPDIRLLKGKPSILAYGPGTYLGNVILQKDDLRIIKDFISTNRYKYVVFAPKKIIGEHFGYEISVTNNDLTNKMTLITLTATAITANPSPPKKY